MCRAARTYGKTALVRNAAVRLRAVRCRCYAPVRVDRSACKGVTASDFERQSRQVHHPHRPRRNLRSRDRVRRYFYRADCARVHRPNRSRTRYVNVALVPVDDTRRCRGNGVSTAHTDVAVMFEPATTDCTGAIVSRATFNVPPSSVRRSVFDKTANVILRPCVSS